VGLSPDPGQATQARRALLSRNRPQCPPPQWPAIGAASRPDHLAGKLISVIFYCLRSGTTYDPQRHARDLGIADAWHNAEA
jgi:hypothetical protein